MDKVGKVYLTEHSDVKKIDDDTWVSYHKYCVCKYENVRKLTQEELDELGFTSQQYVADETMYEIDEWNSLHDTQSEENEKAIYGIYDEMVNE